MNITRPMLGIDCDNLESLRYPLLAQPKLDGIRCLMLGSKAHSRSFKTIPNNHIRTTLESMAWGIDTDGEIYMHGKDFNTIQSEVMSIDGKPDFEYHVFDSVNTPEEPFIHRHAMLDWNTPKNRIVKQVNYITVACVQDVERYLDFCLRAGYEGCMLRDPQGRYKSGRSTLSEQLLIKVKPFAEEQATVIGFKERMSNYAAATQDAFGLTKRSKTLGTQFRTGMLGAFIVHSDAYGEFSVGNGMSDIFRSSVWDNRDSYMGKTIVFKHFKHRVKDKPSSAVYIRTL